MQTTRISYIPGDSHRLSILTQHEIEELYGLPRFTDEDRQTCFDLSEPERHAVHSRTTSVAVHLTLQLGYFKAKRQFFDYDQDAVRDDLLHILGRHFPGKNPATINLPSYPTRRALQHTVLELVGFRLCDSSSKEELERRGQRIAMHSTQPIYILRETLQHLNQQRIVAPIYTFLQDMVGRAVTEERSASVPRSCSPLRSRPTSPVSSMACCRPTNRHSGSACSSANRRISVTRSFVRRSSAVDSLRRCTRSPVTFLTQPGTAAKRTTGCHR